jgi:hypothetical protein
MSERLKVEALGFRGSFLAFALLCVRIWKRPMASS